jgi:hypothetical protein
MTSAAAPDDDERQRRPKMLATKFTLKPIAIASAAVFALMTAPAVIDLGSLDDLSIGAAAWAAESSDGKGKMQGGPPSGMGQRGQGGAGSDIGGAGKGQGGPSGDSDAKGPRYGGEGAKPVPGTQGGKQSWSSLELTDIGRLNVVRAPAQVLDRAETNAIAELPLNADGTYNVAFYTEAIKILTSALSEADKLVALKTLLANPAYTRIDSPLANLAFYKDIMADGVIKDASGNVVLDLSSYSRDVVGALFIGQAADKTLAITADTVHAVDVILAFPSEAGASATVNPDAAQDALVAVPADIVRTAISEVHEGE